MVATICNLLEQPVCDGTHHHHNSTEDRLEEEVLENNKFVCFLWVWGLTRYILWRIFMQDDLKINLS